MGQMTDAKIAAWQKAAGIEPPTGDRAKKLREMSRSAYDLIQVIGLESSGIRDGDGFWYGSDPLSATVEKLLGCWRQIEGDKYDSPDDDDRGCPF